MIRQSILMLNLTRPALALIVNRQSASLDIFSADIDLIFLRDRQASDDELKETMKILQNSKSAGTKLIINSPVYKHWFATMPLDGWHLPENAEIQNSEATSFLMGRSVHSVAAAQKAVTEKMDYVIAGTIFDTASHPGKIPESVQLLRDIKAACPALPMLAIGGITPDNAAQCLDAGASGIVVQSGILSAKDPISAIQNYRQVLDEHYSHTQRQSSHAG